MILILDHTVELVVEVPGHDLIIDVLLALVVEEPLGVLFALEAHVDPGVVGGIRIVPGDFAAGDDHFWSVGPLDAVGHDRLQDDRPGRRLDVGSASGGGVLGSRQDGAGG